MQMGPSSCPFRNYGGTSAIPSAKTLLSDCMGNGVGCSSFFLSLFRVSSLSRSLMQDLGLRHRLLVPVAEGGEKRASGRMQNHDAPT